MPSFSVNGANLLKNAAMEISAEEYYNVFEYRYNAPNRKVHLLCCERE